MQTGQFTSTHTDVSSLTQTHNCVIIDTDITVSSLAQWKRCISTDVEAAVSPPVLTDTVDNDRTTPTETELLYVSPSTLTAVLPLTLNYVNFDIKRTMSPPSLSERCAINPDPSLKCIYLVCVAVN
ncbi:hypothetical protein NP493_400g00014 [Ridgeia piscesae]|uniref:Uncharacterized protein n=1 Tax=Ridgeia piscesae TaxID=27915 RepID=A0AAD9L2K2_RIDPI|nr:hypothetical protein NP493_400g00014 [Ridgeia piscesae]